MKWGLAGLLLVSVVVGCGVTDTGNPPLTPPFPEQMAVMTLDVGLARLIGEPGAVPEGDLLRVVDLDTQTDAVDIPVATDGSFEGRIPGRGLTIVRLTALESEGEGRAWPIDLAPGLIAPPRVLGCARVVAPQALDIGVREGESAVEIRLLNQCEQIVDISFRSRRGEAEGAALDFLAPDPSQLSPGEARAVDVEVVARGEEPAEEILFVEFGAAGSVDRVAVTVRVD